MGIVEPRSRENASDRAERAFLTASDRPTPGAGSAIRSVDLYSGAGGLSLGIAEAARALARAFRPVNAFEIDDAAADIYEANFPGVKMHRESVAAVFSGRYGAKPNRAERTIAREVGDLDFLLAGPPCQGWSSLNNYTRGDDPKNKLYARVSRAVEVLEPRFVLIENVTAARNDTKGRPQRTIARLEKLGYTVADGVIPMLSIGVAQRRRRHVVIGVRDGKLAFDIDQMLKVFAAGPRTLRWAIADLAGAWSDELFDEPSTVSKDNQKRIKFLTKKKRYNLPNWMRPKCHREDPGHTYFSMYGRLKWNMPAQTVTSGYGSMGQGRYVHPTAQRTLTPHEAARLQFFPDWFDFGDHDRSAWATVIGNAVPPKLSYVIALSLLR